MSKAFYVEFTYEDRIKIETKTTSTGQLKGLRIKYQTAKKTAKVNYSTVGFDPFFEYDWLTIVKYENLKGEAIRDFMKPTPVTFSPHGLHLKESWGVISTEEFVAKILNDMKEWSETRKKYDDSLSPIENDRKVMSERNLVRVSNFIKYILSFKDADAINAYNNIYNNQTLIPIPMPEEDDWLLEQNSISANRIEKRAHRGDPDIVSYGRYRVLTYQRSGEEEV